MSPRLLPLLALLLAALPAPASAEGLRRFALVVGNDEGGDGTRPLLYARDDARKMLGILRSLGGVRPEDSALLLDASAEKVLVALSELERKVQAAEQGGERTALVVYYSGHAKEGALRLGESLLPFESLKARLAQSPADIRIGIFDACQSGLMTRTKGLRRAPEFAIEADAARDAKGTVILTSSASDEDSQESDLIGGSYFSHHLSSGLRGDADRSGDGRVTLSEAYAYAYERTVADTATSSAGAQHPTFSYDLKGNGDLVLTELGRRGEGLLFPSQAPGGVYFVVDGRGFVAAEVWKPEGAERRIALGPGSYRVKRRSPAGDSLRVGEVKVTRDALARVDEASFKTVPFTDDPVKGVGRAARLQRRWSFHLSGGYQSFLDGSASLFPASPLVGIEAQQHHFFGRDWTLALDVGLGGKDAALRTETLDAPYRYGTLTAGAAVLSEWPTDRWVPYLGGRLALIVMSREFEGDIEPGSQTFYALTPGLVAGVRYRVGRAWSLGARARLHYLLYKIDEERSLAYWELSSLLSYEL